MKKMLGLLFVFVAINSYSQSKHYNTKKGYVANGYDVVSYFDGVPLQGKKEFTGQNDGVRYKFANQVNLEKFKADPSKYVPKYGGYCAYAVAVSGKKVSVNPETFEIRNGELYLFYNSGKNNTLELWLTEGPTELKLNADRNWEEISRK
ncbi:MAG: YHS domain-containing (seleno)protein [Bacteroidota bacterium]